MRPCGALPPLRRCASVRFHWRGAAKSGRQGLRVSLLVLAPLGASLFLLPQASAQMRDCAAENGLRAATTGSPVELSFRNASGERKRLHWIDYDSDRKFYTVVEPGKVYRPQTASGHAWVIADDSERCQTLVVAPADPATFVIGGTSAAQMAPPAPGIRQPIAQAPIVQPQPAPPPVVQAPQAVVPGPAAPAQQAMAAVPLPQISPVKQFQDGPRSGRASGTRHSAMVCLGRAGARRLAARRRSTSRQASPWGRRALSL